jgi:hypothetical protein
LITIEIIEVNGEKVEININKTKASKNINVYKKDIFRWLERIGIKSDFIHIEHSHYGYEDSFAEIRWMVNSKEYHYRCDSQETATSCVAAIEQLVHYEVIFIERGIKTFGQVMNQFRLGFDPDAPHTKTPREIIGVEEQSKDLGYIDFKYKQKAKELHPDQGGDTEQFKELNQAYEQLKKELK